MPLKANIAANVLQEQQGARQLGAPYSPSERFRTTWKPGQIIRHLVRRGADDCFEALTKRAFSGESSVVVRECEIAEKLLVSERTVRTYIRILEDLGLISTRREWRYDPRWKHPTLVNRYTFHDHEVLRKYLGDDRPRQEINKVGSPSEPPRPAPIPIRPPAVTPRQPAPPLQTAEPAVPPGMSMLCWYSREMQTMMFYFFPADQAAPAPEAAKSPRRAAAKTAGTRNPIPETSPYYQAVRTIARATFFRSSDPTAYEDVAAEFERLQATPEIADKIARDIVRSEAGYQFRMIENFYHLNRSSDTQVTREPDKPIEPEPIECETCRDTGVAGGDHKDTAVFCGCAAGQERIAKGWVSEYEGNFSSYWRGIFQRSKVNPERKPPERETGHPVLQDAVGSTP